MNFSLFMAKRYLFSKKSHNLINVISSISMMGLSIGTAVLIIVLSVFNGFEHVVKSLYHTFNPDFLITTSEGKTFHYDSFPQKKIASFPGVLQVGPVVEEDALFQFDRKQSIGRLKGYPKSLSSVLRLDTLMQQGNFLLRSGDINYAVVGSGIAWTLGIQSSDRSALVNVFVPRRGTSSINAFEQSFNSETLPVSGIFSVQQDFDQRYILTSIDLVRKLMNYTDEATSAEVYIKKDVDQEVLQQKMKEILGNSFSVKNRFQQNESLYKIMKSEKTAIFLILVFILILTSFNMIGSISLLIVEKVKDLAILKSMGAEKNTLRKIFLKQGMLISFISASIGLLLGFVVLYLQQTYGLVRLGGPEGGFVINVYPVKMEVLDFIMVFITVQIIGLLASWYPVRFLLKDFRNIKLQ